MGLRIVILGAPGAGKGTQARKLAEKRGIPHISTGDIFRAHLSEGTEFARQIDPYMKSGALVPDELTIAIVEERLGRPDCRDGYVLDGFPRSLEQTQALERMTASQGPGIDAAIDLRVPDDELVARMGARRTCAECGTIYNLKFNPPKGGGMRCDRNGCGGQLVQRPDDNEDTIRQRLFIYHKTAGPIYEYYEERGILHIVRGDVSPEVVFATVEDIVCGVEVA
ncbi:MAG: adenylate kinase [Candidatus Hydrogenedentes bacterium]|nr:adenylate kinase [Candidatus Hydrogenedentota bacterium]